jgi:hypothetical protein
LRDYDRTIELNLQNATVSELIEELGQLRGGLLQR